MSAKGKKKTDTKPKKTTSPAKKKVSTAKTIAKKAAPKKAAPKKAAPKKAAPKKAAPKKAAPKKAAPKKETPPKPKAKPKAKKSVPVKKKPKEVVVEQVGIVQAFRKKNKRQAIVFFDSLPDQNVGKLIGRQVRWVYQENAKRVMGVITKLHGRRNQVLVNFKRQLPGQAIGTYVSVL
ncbi:MAG: 50S ribosomal protein L35ae [Candidatus Ranarchaeia archaeon]|jgi:ribosomal protein L35AE/L33A